jgi:hypothetical protein
MGASERRETAKRNVPIADIELPHVRSGARNALCNDASLTAYRVGRRLAMRQDLGDHAVVLDASIAGLLAAQVLTGAHRRHEYTQPACAGDDSPRWQGYQ